jgi:hypothetical protein
MTADRALLVRLQFSDRRVPTGGPGAFVGLPSLTLRKS